MMHLLGAKPPSSIKRFAYGLLGVVLTAATLVLGFFALTFVLTVGAVAALVGLIWWQFSGKKRFAIARNAAFGAGFSNPVPSPSDAPLAKQGHVIEGEFVRRE